jgi:hypothetical protein
MHAVKRQAVKQMMVATLATVALGAPAYGAGLEGLAGVKASGYVEGQYVYNLNAPQSNTNQGRVFDTNANSFTMNMAELVLNKTTDKGLGFGLVLNYGEDARFLDSTSGSPVFVQQAYVTDRVLGDRLDLKFGKFATLAGAEVIEGPANFNISRSFLFGFAIPFTHTGVRASMAGMKNMSFILGLNNGWDNDSDAGSGKTIEAQFGLTPMDTVSLLLNGYYGDEATSLVDQDKRGLIDLVATLKPTDGMTFVFNYDRGSQMKAGGAGTGSALWQGYALYANLAVGAKNAVSARYEYFDDNDGVRTPAAIPVSAREVTLTFSSKLKENLEWRAELRHDMASDDVFEDDDGTFTDSQDTIAVAAYYSF